MLDGEGRLRLNPVPNTHAKESGYLGSISSLMISFSAAIGRSCYLSVPVHRAQCGMFSSEMRIMTTGVWQGFNQSYLQMALIIYQGK